jgi:hypothetical protein
MIEQHQPRPRRVTSSIFNNLSLLATGGVAMAALLMLIGVLRTGMDFFERLQLIFNASPPEVDVRSLVVRQVRGASELTTAVFAMEAVVPTSQDRQFGGVVLGKTTLLYIAYGEVRAGVDLGELQPEDVQVNGDIVQIRLPPPRILDSKIDVNRSSVYDYDRGFLGLGPDVAPQLQTLAERETLKKIVAAACREDFLAEANDKAELAVTKLLNTLDDKKVEVETQPPSPETCTNSSS